MNMNDAQMAELAVNIVKPMAKQAHANSLAHAGLIAYLATKGIIDLDDCLHYMNGLKDNLVQSSDYDEDTKEAIRQQFDFYQEKLKG